eukprot:TRINITY_DN941_c0_g1_i1.p1 TRINITY_DN941_c0_g1~~TRINITY_DN941_c0_g1_i1.p1  ORF type:complete len:651 (-),score=175.08 TRINITY_DN941_c0_g1_i1:101-2053(-)
MRTKEALLAAHGKSRESSSSGEGKSRVRFSPLEGGVDVRSIALLAAGLFLIIFPFFLPDLGRSFTTSRIYNYVQNQELVNDVHPGQFRLSGSAGDTRPNANANFYAASILKSAGLRLKNTTAAEALVQRYFKNDQFGNSLREIYQTIVYAKSLGLFQEGNAASKKIYDRILRLGEKSSGFRLTEEYTPSVEATFYGFESISELGRFSDFQSKKESVYSSACAFVASAQNEDGGFRNKGLTNSTLEATYFALLVLSRCNSTGDVDFSRAQSFVSSTQLRSGAFSELLENAFDGSNSAQSLYSSNSNNVLSTIKAAYSLLLLETRFAISRSRSLFGSGVDDAISFLTNLFGSSDKRISTSNRLEEYYHFNRLLSQFGGSISYGIFRQSYTLVFYLGLYLVTLAGFFFVRAKIPASSQLSEFSRLLYLSSLFLIPVSILSILNIFSFIQFLTLLSFSFFFGLLIFEYIENDSSDGLIFLLGFLNFFFFSGTLIFLNLNFIPEMFSNPTVSSRVFLILPLFQGLVSAGVAAVTAYSTRISKMSVYYRGSVVGWAMGCGGLLAWIGSTGTIVGGGGVWALVSLVVVVGAGLGGAWGYWEVESGALDEVKREVKKEVNSGVRKVKEAEEEAEDRVEEVVEDAKEKVREVGARNRRN